MWILFSYNSTWSEDVQKTENSSGKHNFFIIITKQTI